MIQRHGNYYLWVKGTINGKQLKEVFGPYAIKDHTTLASTKNEASGTAAFLGNKNIQRGKIKSITILDSFTDENGVTHKLEDENCWDVTASKNGNYIAWYEEENGAYKVTIAGKGGVLANSNSSYLFYAIGYSLEEKTQITGLENLDTQIVVNMKDLFAYSKIADIDLSSLDTRNGTNMMEMFRGCTNLTELDLSSFDTSNVTNMRAMFQTCINLSELNISSFNTTNVVNMYNTFSGCKKLETLNLENFNTANVTTMYGMFAGCEKLTDLNVKSFNTSKVRNMQVMFDGCTVLPALDLSSFNTENVTSMFKMFNVCKGLTTLDISNFNTKNVTYMSMMFYNCPQLTTIYAGENFNTDKIEGTGGYIFRYNSKLVGGQGTKFSSSHTGKEYAHLDGGVENPGYFTKKVETP